MMRNRNFTIDIPIYWTIDQAEAVVLFLEDIIETIRADYAEFFSSSLVEPPPTTDDEDCSF